MKLAAKNLLILGASLTFLVFFFVYAEINKSQGMIDAAEDINLSIERGFEDAEQEFEGGFAYFQRYEGEYLGISKSELEALYGERSSFFRFYCSFGNFTDSIALKIGQYEHNEHYVLAYNTRLKTLMGKHVNNRP